MRGVAHLVQRGDLTDNRHCLASLITSSRQLEMSLKAKRVAEEETLAIRPLPGKIFQPSEKTFSTIAIRLRLDW